MASPKDRIIGHMNADHADSLEDYLKHFNRITPKVGSAKMIDLQLDSLKIEYVDGQGKTKTSIVKINPPMQSLSESRVKLVAMAEEATGKSFHQPPDITPVAAPTGMVPTPLKTPIGWTFPEFPGLISTALICFGYWALSQEYPLAVGGPLEKVLPRFLVEFGRNFKDQLFAFMIGIHVVEALVVAMKCIDNGAAIPITILWTVNGFIEGGPAITRVNKLIKNKEKGHHPH